MTIQEYGLRLPWIEPGLCDMTPYLALGVRRVFAPKEMICAWSKDDALYYLEQGEVRAGTTNHDGSERMMFMLGRQTIFGESLYFDQGPSIVTFTAVKRSVIYTFSFETMDQLLREDRGHQLSRDIMLLLTRKVKVLVRQLSDSALNDPQYRLLKLIYMLSEEYGCQDGGRIVIPKAFTHQALADLTGLHRVTVTKTLQQLSQRQIIEKRRDCIIVLDKAYLDSQVLPHLDPLSAQHQ